ncbi:hypothetical protein KRR40_00605 [Niabella defluvii]|nr:hypothetical protein KRR40_00605 [Niabella sp. I65]
MPNRHHYNFYTIGIGIGTLIGNSLFIFGGRLIASKIQNNQSVMNYVIAGIFVITALIQMWRMFVKKKDVADKIHDEEEKEKDKLRTKPPESFFNKTGIVLIPFAFSFSSFSVPFIKISIC